MACDCALWGVVCAEARQITWQSTQEVRSQAPPMVPLHRQRGDPGSDCAEPNRRPPPHGGRGFQHPLILSAPQRLALLPSEGPPFRALRGADALGQEALTGPHRAARGLPVQAQEPLHLCFH